MSRLPLVDPNQSSAAKPLLDAVTKKLGRAPNLTRAMANAPAVLKAYLEFSGALAGGVLPARTRELVALAVGEENGCDYCVAAHTAIGGSLGLSPDAMLDARAARAADPKAAAVLRLARAVVVKRGRTSDADVNDARAAGVSDAEIAETVAAVALNVFTNWFNLVAETPVDFPDVPRLAARETSAAGASCGCR